MASINSDDNAGQEIGVETRRTRSGRKVVTNTAVTTRSTRSSKRMSESEYVTEALTEEVQEIECNIDGAYDQQMVVETIPDDKSSSFPFQTELNALYDQGSGGVPLESEQITSTDSIDNLLANLAEDNANSLPSVDEQSSQQAFINAQREANSESSSSPAIAEEVPNGCSQATNDDGLDAEMVSEDELPAPAQPKVDDAEEVSDEELPGPKLAELPADTEVVSEDELPSSSKTKRKADDGYDPSSPTEGAEITEKRQKTEVNADNEDDSNKIESKEEKKSLPDLDKYWKPVNDDPTDFTGWTYLLQYVDQENDTEAAREAYDAFLAHYPYCYGYWRKYADFEKRKGNKKKCEEVFERGLKAIPLSVDLWIHYLAHVKSNHADDEEFVRSQFERALVACGLEFRSDKLWEAYIKWETDGKRLRSVVSIYDRLLSTPTQGYNGHFDNFQDIVNNNPIISLISSDELKKLRTDVRESEKTESTDLDIAPGEEEPDDHVRDEAEAAAIKDRVLSARRKIHKATVAAVTARWTFEENIKRPYFHVKPLEKCQLNNWKDYLDFEIEQGDRKRILVLFERCLIACALYDEFWLKMIRYLETQNAQDQEMIQKTREVYERACTIHHPNKPNVHLMWSAFEELNNNLNKSAEILSNLDKVCPNVLQIAYRRINLERRRGDLDKCSSLYEHYIANIKNKNNSSSLAIKYARFCHKIKGDLDGGLKVLRQALEKDPHNARIVLQMIDLALQRIQVDEKEVLDIMEKFMNRENLDLDQKILFAQRKVEFLEDFGTSAKDLQDAQRLLQSLLTKANESKKKASESSPQKKTSKDSSNSNANSTTAQSSTATYNNSYYNSSNNSAYYGNAQYTAQGYGDSYNYNQWQQQYGSNYGSYGQWSGYNSSGYY